MSQVKLHDKSFEVFIEAEHIQKRVAELALEIDQAYGNEPPVFLVVLNGAFMFASDLVKAVKADAPVFFVKYESYVGTSSSGKVKASLDPSPQVAGRRVMLIEDIVDTGRTMAKAIEALRQAGAVDVQICTFLHKPSAVQVALPVRFVGFDIPNDFVVGYGLDYDDLGRTYRDLYRIKK